MKRYVIMRKNQYIKWASILSVDGFVSINKVAYTNQLMEAEVFNEDDKKEDIAAWEEFYDSVHEDGFLYQEIEFQIK